MPADVGGNSLCDVHGQRFMMLLKGLDHVQPNVPHSIMQFQNVN